MTDDFWKYCLETYGMGNTEPLLIEAQDRFGADINLILFLSYLHNRNLTVTSEAFQDLLSLSARWQQETLRPARSARRAAKGTASYDEMKTRELALERQEQQAFFNASSPHPGRGDWLQAYLAFMGVTAPLRTRIIFCLTDSQT